MAILILLRYSVWYLDEKIVVESSWCQISPLVRVVSSAGEKKKRRNKTFGHIFIQNFVKKNIQIFFSTGMQEVIEGLPIHEPRSNIDRLIEALAQRQNIQGQDGEMVDERDENGEAQVRQIASPRGHRPGLRRAGDVEGIRQTSGNWQRDNTTPWNKPILAKPVHPAIRETLSKLL